MVQYKLWPVIAKSLCKSSSSYTGQGKKIKCSKRTTFDGQVISSIILKTCFRQTMYKYVNS